MAVIGWWDMALGKNGKNHARWKLTTVEYRLVSHLKFLPFRSGRIIPVARVAVVRWEVATADINAQTVTRVECESDIT